MKKMYILTLSLIAAITVGFLLFSCDIHQVNKRFLSSYDITIDTNEYREEAFKIPSRFDTVYDNYNLMQLESGLDLSKYKGKYAVRYTYPVLNFPDALPGEIYVNVICINRRPIAGDIMCPALTGFIQPLNFLTKY